jgi:hypothetical protein
MDAYTLTGTRTKTHWRRGLALAWWAIVAIPASALAERPVLHPGTERYRDSAPPSISRLGGATLMARALLGKGGETTVEVSTSTLDTATLARGSISKLQIKLLDNQGRVRGTENHMGLSSSGRLQLILGGLGRGQPLRLQANIEGVDSSRTGVVTVQTEVRRRPDLAVERLSAPPSVQAGMPVNISALVAERNGDTGAEADCVLRVDGAEVDRAPGIWVDAASAVSCAFSHTFASSGTRVLTVEVADVVPSDDELSNNQTTASIEVINWRRFHHSALVESVAWRNVTLTDGWYTQVNATQRLGSEWTNRQEQSGWHQSVELRGELPYAMTFPVLAFELEHSSGGARIPGTSFYQLEADSTWETSTPHGTYTVRCVWETDPLTAANLTLCSRTGPAAQQTYFTYSRYGGEVTYFSGWYQATWTTHMTSGETRFSEWTSNSGSSTPTEAERWAVGPSYDFDVRLIDGARRYRATPSVALKPYNSKSGQPYTCSGSDSPSYSSRTCRSTDNWTEWVRGSFVSSDP